MLVLIGLSLSAASAAAQEQPDTATDKASLSGTVTRKNGTVVHNAKAEIKSASGARLALPVNDKGVYSITGLHPGFYTVTISADNFAEVVFENINLTPGRKMTLDATLEPASAKPAVAADGSGQAEQGAASATAPTTRKISGDKGTISGIATDPTGAVVTDARAVLTSAAGARLETPVNEKGVYSFTDLNPGTYKLVITAPNFADMPFDNIALTAGLELTLDAALVPAKAKAEEVNVESGELGKVETESSTVSGTITQKEVVSIGLNGRNFTQLIALAPGVSNQTGQDEAKGGVVGSVKYSVNGGRVEYNTFEVDGSDVLNTGLNGASSTLMVYPSLDAIQEVKVLTSNYGAQFGRTASGTVQVTTKSGTEKLHGNIYDFVRNEAFNSRNYFDPAGGAPLYRRQDFGGTIGGPLFIPHVYNTKRNKTFFFFSEEVRLEKTPTDYNQAVPSLKERGLVMTAQGIQKNLSPPNSNGLVSQVFDFSDVCPLPGTANSLSFSRQQFPDCPSLGGDPAHLQPIYNLLGQQLAGSPANIGVDKNALAILEANFIPVPNSPTGCNFAVANLDPTDPNHCYNAAVSPSSYWREELFHIDQTVTPKARASFRYIHDAWNTSVLTPQWGTVQNTFPTIQNKFTGPGTSLVGRLTDTISSTLLNDFVVTYVNSNITLVDEN